MNLNKKTIALLLAVVLSISFVACTKNIEQANTTTTTISQTQQKTQKSTEPITTTAKTVETTKKTTEGSTISTTSKSTTKVSSTTKLSTTKKAEKTTAKDVINSVAKKATTATTTTEEPTIKNACFITIQCKSILSHKKDLAKGHEAYVPTDGYIIKRAMYSVNDGDTAYDVLKAVCKENGVKLTSRDTVYGVYIIGINNLDEKDCGVYSGWKYKVNGVYPSVAVDKTKINVGDKIEFEYVCEY